MSNYLIYPLKVMRITQTYTGTTSHKGHTTGSPKDYPIDDGGSDTGRDWLYAPCDEVKVIRIYGVGNGGTNTIWLESSAKVNFADGTSDIFSMQVTHPNDDDLSKIKVGQKFKRGEKICREGSDGATGNHLHLSVGKGKITGNGWTLNSNDKYVLTTHNGSYKPEQLFLIDPSFTKILDKKGLPFKNLSEGNDMTRGYFKQGDSNEGVLSLKQQLITLKKLGIITQGVDDNDIFGDGTLAAVKQAQKAAGITVDGLAGPITIKSCGTLINKKIASGTSKEVAELEEKISKAIDILS